jgi:hypothetical protein
MNKKIFTALILTITICISLFAMEAPDPDDPNIAHLSVKIVNCPALSIDELTISIPGNQVIIRASGDKNQIFYLPAGEYQVTHKINLKGASIGPKKSPKKDLTANNIREFLIKLAPGEKTELIINYL